MGRKESNQTNKNKQTLKGKERIWSIFFPFIVAPMRTENNFKGTIQLRNRQN